MRIEGVKMGSWKKTISTPFKKACTFFNQQQQEDDEARDKKAPNSVGGGGREGERRRVVMDLHGEVMACGYEDVQVMWSILDKSKSDSDCNTALASS